MTPIILILARPDDNDGILACQHWITQHNNAARRSEEGIVVTNTPTAEQWGAHFILCASMAEFMLCVAHPHIANASITVVGEDIDTRDWIPGGPQQRKVLAKLMPVIAGLMRSFDGPCGKAEGFEEEATICVDCGKVFPGSVTDLSCPECIQAEHDRLEKEYAASQKIDGVNPVTETMFHGALEADVEASHNESEPDNHAVAVLYKGDDTVKLHHLENFTGPVTTTIDDELQVAASEDTSHDQPPGPPPAPELPVPVVTRKKPGPKPKAAAV